MKRLIKEHKKVVTLFSIIVIVVCMGMYGYCKLEIKYEIINLKGQKYGIIDGSMEDSFEHVICLNKNASVDGFSHGKEMCSFIKRNYKNYEIYYYNAEINGKMSSESIIAGLERLKAEGISKINLSLSSKVYSHEMQKWINDNDDVTIYASYTHKSIAAFIYLIDNGRELEFEYENSSVFVSQDGSSKFCSIWVNEEEQAFDSVDVLFTDAVIQGKKLYEIWKEVRLGTLF